MATFAPALANQQAAVGPAIDALTIRTFKLYILEEIEDSIDKESETLPYTLKSMRHFAGEPTMLYSRP